MEADHKNDTGLSSSYKLSFYTLPALWNEATNTKVLQVITFAPRGECLYNYPH